MVTRSTRRKRTVIGTYSCGCPYGPMFKQQRSMTCPQHGEEIQREYDVTRFVRKLPKPEDLEPDDGKEQKHVRR